MDLSVGAILEGKVKSITNFGAFIALPENKTGMVHISEVANAYVSDIRQYLTEGQDVKVMVIAADPGGKINLSIKRLEPKPAQQSQTGGQRSRPPRANAAPTPPPAPKTAAPPLWGRLKRVMSEAGSKISPPRPGSDHRTKNRRR